MLLQHAATAAAAASAGAHPLSGTVADWIWLVLAFPLAGAFVNGVLAMITEWRPGPFDPDPVHTGEFPIPSRTLVERAERRTPRLMSAVELQRVPERRGTGVDRRAEGATPGEQGDHGDHHDEGQDEGGHTPRRHPFLPLVSVVGTGAVAAAFVVAVLVFLQMLRSGADAPYVLHYWDWMTAGTFHVEAALQVDRLSIMMTLVVTGVGALIHLFSTAYMKNDGAYARFFAYLNLFVFQMLILVLGANYPIMFVGWEGVGLCSFLLISFWFTEKANADAGKKAFIVNRIGDFGFLVAMFLMFWNFGSLDFAGVMQAATAVPTGSVVATAIALFLFLGAAGKSAQIPLYVWLPDAMAGPTPVSALIHAATMVTAGVYLVARSSAIFAAAPAASLTVVVIGTLTAVFAATIALKQWDIKKVLAYSTVSQLGYMFVGVGAGAYTAGLFHVVTHAFFKALLFLGAGAVIDSMHHAYHAVESGEDAQDMRNMGGLRRFMPVTFVTMWIATLAISGIFPFAGFFSKDEILGAAFAQAHGSVLANASWLGIPGSAILYTSYVLLLSAALLTAIYMTRMMLYTFHGPNRSGDLAQRHLHEAGPAMLIPLVVLAALSVAGGWLNVPELLAGIGPVGALDHWLEPVVGASTRALGRGAAELTHGTEWALVGGAVTIAALGVLYAILRLRPADLRPKALSPAEPAGIQRTLANKYYVDEAYDAAIVRPTLFTSRNILFRGLDVGIIDRIFVVGFGWQFPRVLARIGSGLQTGRLGGYAWALLLGVVIVLGAFTLR